MNASTLPPPAPTAARDLATPPVASGSVGGQGLKFVLIGSAGTLVQLGLYGSAADLIGAQIASALAWLISTLVTNAAHRAVTFGVRGHTRNRADQVVAFLTCLVGLLITSLVLTRISDADGPSGIMAILVVNSVVGAARFGGMRWWLSAAGQRFGTHVAAAVNAARGSWDQHRRLGGQPH
ncbi:Putative flippase GtrA (transmembrane translocase of bactoprenol-linked glucose) [Nakamurella panacisegetis]|uniref:Putative flippase GtrA (Transmembrane translocase of bactoprenol-linked glucose) n=1 Tax=Nakamurella panacisegetis TaxID=1090615 RepID=A0A1H0NLS1_9ACTN|nr:GtrA family protein [Nakamurella panacisegetis]SDO93702.1 Putative flippase GtrA (transmembrane translocase of bactoprenol-linked glucose) [Nakamurella panacisegetis]